jgi:hypothetical protein
MARRMGCSVEPPNPLLRMENPPRQGWRGVNAPAFAVTVLRALAGKRLVETFSTDPCG